MAPETDCNSRVHLSALNRALADDDLHIPARLPSDSGETAIIGILASIASGGDDAHCDFCEHHWYASDREMQRHADLMEQGYPEPLATHADRVIARLRANTPRSQPTPIDEIYRQWEAADTRETMCEGPGE